MNFQLFLKNSNKTKPVIQPDSVFSQKVFEQSKVENDFLANQKLGKLIYYCLISSLIDKKTSLWRKKKLYCVNSSQQ